MLMNCAADLFCVNLNCFSFLYHYIWPPQLLWLDVHLILVLFVNFIFKWIVHLKLVFAIIANINEAGYRAHL